MKIRRSIRSRTARLTRWAGHLRFALGGSTLNHKVNAYYLWAAIESPFEPRPRVVQDKIMRSGHVVPIRHSVFHDYLLRFDLLDNFEMAIAREFFVERAYDLNRLRFVPRRIVDCGAYRGYFTLLAHAAFPQARITAIEAHPGNAAKIAAMLRENDVQHVELHEAALSGSREASICLYVGGSNGSLEDTFDGPGKQVIVETRDLHDFIGDDRLLLKIDIEGAETDFFPRIISKLPPTCGVFLETHDEWNTLRSVEKEFAECGFEFQVLNERGQFIDSFAQRVDQPAG